MFNRRCINCLSNYLKLVIRSHHNEKIHVKPPVSLTTEQVSITGSGFAPLSPITITAKAQCEPEELSFASYGHYITCENGQFDMSTSESLSGTYMGVDKMGLFWSMKAKEDHTLFQLNNATLPLHYEFSVLNGHIDNINDESDFICKTSIIRRYAAQGVKRQLVREKDVQGTLYIPEGSGPFPAIILVLGGLKRKQIVEDPAAIFANNGFVCLVLAFFGYDGLPKKYIDEPVRIEYFENAIKYISALDFVNENAIGVQGYSKGADIVLAMASFLPQIKTVVWVGGIVSACGTSTTYGDHVFPDCGIDLSKALQLPDGSISLKHCVNQVSTKHPSVFPFEKSKADMLFIVGLDDLCAPSEEHADIAKKKMDDVNKTNYEIIKYPGLGHIVRVPFSPPCSMSPHVFLKGLFNFGGSDRQKHALQVVSVWSKIISFCKQSLGKHL